VEEGRTVCFRFSSSDSSRNPAEAIAHALEKMLADGGARKKKASRLSCPEAFEERNL
jgi:hypothetical protein